MSESEAHTAAAPARRQSAWYIVLALAIGLLLLGLAVRKVDRVAVARAVAGVSFGWLALGALGLILAQALLAVRWHILVDAGDRLSVGDAFDFVMIGNFAGLVLPSRLGDVARAVAAGRYHALSSSRLLGTIIVERLLDVIMLIGFGVALSVLMAIPSIVQGALTSVFVAAVAAVAILWMGETGPLGALLRVLTRLFGAGSRIVSILSRFVDGIAAVRTRGRVPSALLAALAVWVCSALAAGCSVAAFGVSAPWYAGAFVVVVINLGGLVPAPPAGIGVYHYLATLALSPWAGSSSTAFAFAAVTHALSVTIVLALGTVSLLRKGLSLRGLRRMAAGGVPDPGILPR